MPNRQPQRQVRDQLLLPINTFSSYHTSNTGPSQHEPTEGVRKQPSTEPYLPPRTTALVPSFSILIQPSRARSASEIFLWCRPRKQGINESGKDHVRGEIEPETLERFETENASGDAE